MSLKAHFELMASYNQWMNDNIYEAAGRLSASELVMDRGAFFGSILGTLNHVVVGDTIWLQRFSAHPASKVALREVAALPSPTALDQPICPDLGSLREHRAWLDRKIIDWIDQLSEVDLGSVLSFHSMKGVPGNKRYSKVVLHFFNHQTHHRGQASALLSQAGVDVGTTDLLVRIAEEGSP